MSNKIAAPGAVISVANVAPSPFYRFFIPGAEEVGALTARDKSGNGRVATPPTVAGVTTRANSTAYALNALIRRAVDDGFIYRCNLAGTTAASEPSSNYNSAAENTATVTDGTAGFVKVSHWVGFPGALSCGPASVFDSGFSLPAGAPAYNIGGGQSFIWHLQVMKTSGLLTGSGATTILGDRYDGNNPGMRLTICRAGTFIPASENRFGFTVQSRSGGDGSGSTQTLDFSDTVSGIETTPAIVNDQWHTVVLAVDGTNKLAWFGVDGTFASVVNGASAIGAVAVSSLTNTLAVQGIHAGSAPGQMSGVACRFKNIGLLRFPGALPSNLGALMARIFSDPHVPLSVSEVR